MTTNRIAGTRNFYDSDFDYTSWLPTTWQPLTRDVKNEIVPRLWVGSKIAAKALYGKKGWTIIDVREFEAEKGIKNVLAIPLLRRTADSLAGRNALKQISAAIDVALARGDNVLVHCWEGIERSPLSVVYWLATRKDMTLGEAYAWIKECRPGVCDRRGWLTRKARRAIDPAVALAA